MRFWTPERVELLKTLNAKSGAQAADILGCTRAMVCAKRIRLGLNVEKTHYLSAVMRTDKKVKAERIEVRDEPPPEDAVPIWDLRPEHCRWPHGDTKDAETFRYCGKSVTKETSWCEHHHKIVYPRRVHASP